MNCLDGVEVFKLGLVVVSVAAFSLISAAAIVLAVSVESFSYDLESIFGLVG